MSLEAEGEGRNNPIQAVLKVGLAVAPELVDPGLAILKRLPGLSSPL